MAQEIHIGDIGTAFRVAVVDSSDVVIDISTATTQEFSFRKPDGTTITKTTVFDTDGTDGIIKYLTIADDLDKSGTWYIQAKVILPTGTWHSSTGSFEVYNNL